MTGRWKGLGMGLVLVMGLGLILALLRGLGVMWDPLGLQQRRLERVEALAQQAQVEALARGFEAKGLAQQVRQIETAEQSLEIVAALTATAQQAAKEAEDAETPLDHHRLERMRAHDRQLCEQAAGLGGCSSASDLTAKGRGAL